MPLFWVFSVFVCLYIVLVLIELFNYSLVNNLNEFDDVMISNKFIYKW